jgi:hypothetical protein
MSEDIQNSEAAPVEDSGTASMPALLSGSLDEGNFTAAGAGEQKQLARPEPERARTFLKLLGDGPWTFQTFDDTRGRKDKSLVAVRHGDLDTHLDELAALNARGAGVYVTVNQTNGKGREATDIVKVRAYFVDLDGAPVDPVQKWELPPHIIVLSSIGRWHAYWLIADAPCDPDTFRQVHEALIKRFHSDTNVKDLPRVMRLPGFFHRKEAPKMVEIVHQARDMTPYTHVQFVAALAKPIARMPASVAPEISGELDLDLLRYALSLLTTDDYDTWLRYLFALKHDLDEDGLEIFLELSSNSPGYQGETDCRRKWQQAGQPNGRVTCHVIFRDAAPLAAEALSAESDTEGAHRVLRLLALGFADDILADTVLHTITKRVPGVTKSGLRNVLKELRRQVGEHRDAGAETDERVQRLLDKYVYSIGGKVYIDLATGDDFDDAQINNAHATDFPLGGYAPTAATVFQNHVAARKVSARIYDPGEEQFFTRDGRTYVNTWRPSRLVPRSEVSDADISQFLDHARFLIPEDRERGIVLDWMAHTVQRPGEKINWAVFLGGEQGIGKDALFAPLTPAVGADNVQIIGPEHLTSQFTPWAEGRLIVIEEMAAFGNVAIVNKLKPFIAAPPYTVQINRKNRHPYNIPNKANYILFSNREDAIPLDEADRRYFIYWSRAEPRDEDYYKAYFGWLDANEDAVYGWLMQRDLKGFNAKGQAPRTEAKKQMAESTRSPLEQFIASAIEESRRPFQGDLVAVADILDYLPRHIVRPTNEKVATCLKKLGARKLPKQALRGERPYQTRPWVWALRDYERYESMSPSELGDALGSEAPTDPPAIIATAEQEAEYEKVVSLEEARAKINQQSAAPA